MTTRREAVAQEVAVCELSPIQKTQRTIDRLLMVEKLLRLKERPPHRKRMSRNIADLAVISAPLSRNPYADWPPAALRNNHFSPAMAP